MAQAVILKAHRRARRTVNALQRKAVATTSERELDRLLEEIAEAQLGERLAKSAAWRA